MGYFDRAARFERAKASRRSALTSYIAGGMTTVVLVTVLLVALSGMFVVSVAALARRDGDRDWFSIIAMSVFAAGSLVGAVWFVRAALLRRDGTPGRIRVIDAYRTHELRNNVPVYKVKAEVIEPTPGRTVYVKVPTFLGVDRGDELHVVIDPKRPDRVAVVPRTASTDAPSATPA